MSESRKIMLQRVKDRQAAHLARVNREKADAEFARSLSQQDAFGGGPSSSSGFARPDPPRTQAYFNSNGQIRKPAVEPPLPPQSSSSYQPAYQSMYPPSPVSVFMPGPSTQPPKPVIKQDPGSSSRYGDHKAQQTIPILDSDSSDLEEITPVQWKAALSSPPTIKDDPVRAFSANDRLLARIQAARSAGSASPAANGMSPYPAPRVPGAVNRMQGGTFVYGAGPPQPYSVHSVPAYGNGLINGAGPLGPPGLPRPGYPGQRMPGNFPGGDFDELMNLMGTQGQGGAARDLPFGMEDSDMYGGGYGGYTPGGMTEDEISEMMKAVQADKHFPIEKRAPTPPSLAVELYAHQKIGLTWLMLQEENKACKGGILADDMGLGKTIQALALIVAKPSDDPARKTTLIVAPVALMRQWEKEIDAKLKKRHKLRVFVYHGQVVKKTNFAKLSNYDVVLTTFGTLASEHKKWAKMTERMIANPGSRRQKEETFSLIDKDCLWYRIIVDEAQCIKNKNTKAAQGAHALKSLYRLCMSGTPMMNNIGELHSLIHFLRIQPYNDLEKFNREIKRPLSGNSQYGKERAMQAVQATLKVIMLRRTKKSEVDGKPIIEGLPERTTEMAFAEFDDAQREYYTALETETQLKVNAYLEAGKIGKNYSYILVRLLRLRQACCHPHLIRDFGENDITTDQMEDLARSFDEKVVARLKESGGDFSCPICLDACPAPSLIWSCGHGVCADCMSRLVDPSNLLDDGDETGRGSGKAKCPECRGVLDPKLVVSWKSFQTVHMPEAIPESEQKAAEEEDSDSDSDSDSSDEDEDDDSNDKDADKNGNLRDFIVDDDEVEEQAEETDDEEAPAAGVKPEDDEETASEAGSDDDFAPVRAAGSTDTKSTSTSKLKKGKSAAKNSSSTKIKTSAKTEARRKVKGKGKKKVKKNLAELKKEGSRNAAAKKKYIKRLQKTWIPSAKTNQTLDLLRTIHDRGDGEKTIIFSQFTTLLDLLEVAMGDEFQYKRYDGSMRPVERNLAVEDFQNPKSPVTVLLVSLKAGNAGLNLTAANQVIILDPFWNPFVEEQAIDRAHRIGQTRPVQVHRVLVQNTVEDRIIALQEKKRELINMALDEKAADGMGRLGLAELRYLFGFDTRLPGGPGAPAPALNPTGPTALGGPARPAPPADIDSTINA